MRKVRHRNVVQFIGACTQKPNLCIVFEFMAGGSIFDHMRKVGSLCCALQCIVASCQGKAVNVHQQPWQWLLHRL